MLSLFSSFRSQNHRHDIKRLMLKPFCNIPFAKCFKREKRGKILTIPICRSLLVFFITTFLLIVIGFNLNYFAPYNSFHELPIWNAWLHWLKNLLDWNLGISNIDGQPISEQLKKALPATMELCILAFSFSLSVGIPIGILSGTIDDEWKNEFINMLILLGLSIPVFWFALLLMFLFSLKINLFPVSGRLDLIYEIKEVTGFFIIDSFLFDTSHRNEIITSVIYHMILPILSLSIPSTTEIIRLTRTNTIKIFNQNYIVASITRGLSYWTILRRHVFHNTLLSLISCLGLEFSSMLTLSIVIETIFNWPGLGKWLINAICYQDYPVISAGIMVIGMISIFVKIISNILEVVVNPLKYKKIHVS